MRIELKRRYIAKAITWRLLATLTTAILVYIFTDSFDIAAIIGGLDLIIKLLVYYTHENIWGYSNYGIEYRKAHVFWLTGLSGSGKSTLANKIIEKYPNEFVLIDGDVLRQGLCSDLGFSDEDRKENMRRLIELCKLYVKEGKSVITSFISPFENERQNAKDNIPNCHIIYIDSPLETCEARDVKGLYARARAGEIRNFTGLDSDYIEPYQPDLIIDTTEPLSKSFRKFDKYIRSVLCTSRT